MLSWRAATLHVLALALIGSMVIATPVPLNLAALVAWVIVVRKWATRRSRSDRHARLNAVAIIQVTGMIALVLAAAFAPVKVMDRQKARYITLPKQVMTVGELAEPFEHGWPRFYDYSVSVPEGLADRAVHFPARELTVGGFISTVEAQTPMRHKFHHCGNGSTILWGGDCSFGLHFRVPVAWPDNALFADGRVRKVRTGIARGTLRAPLTVDGGETVDPGEWNCREYLNPCVRNSWWCLKVAERDKSLVCMTLST